MIKKSLHKKKEKGQVVDGGKEGDMTGEKNRTSSPGSEKWETEETLLPSHLLP